jgi:hypothetical protein
MATMLRIMQLFCGTSNLLDNLDPLNPWKKKKVKGRYGSKNIKNEDVDKIDCDDNDNGNTSGKVVKRGFGSGCVTKYQYETSFFLQIFLFLTTNKFENTFLFFLFIHSFIYLFIRRVDMNKRIIGFLVLRRIMQIKIKKVAKAPKMIMIMISIQNT